MPRLHGYRGIEPEPAELAELVVIASTASTAPRDPLPPARIGRSAIGAGGLLARLWDWIRLPRVEWFRRCARCGLVLDADRKRAGRMIMRTCDGRRREEFGGGCWSAHYELR